ncbi:MAG: hypothetical protein LBI84_06135 [Propionibacteriaceae bacterium]|jgi:hypothetical protein|nr:hypothetical protein [Propionibacteriaceae bacterium]
MRKITAKVVAALAAVMLGVVGVSALSASTANAGYQTVGGCHSGYACLHMSVTRESDIIGEYYYYGDYNLSNVYNNKMLMNNQTGQAWVYECLNYGGKRCTYGWRSAPDYLGLTVYSDITDFTPINSVKLSATSGEW